MLLRVLPALALVSACLAGCASDRIAVVQEFRAAREANDLARARSFLAPDPRLWYEQKEGPGAPWKLEGGAWAVWDEHFRARSRCTDWSVEGDAVSTTAWEINDYYRLTERGEQPVRLTWFFDDEEHIQGFLVRGEGLPRDPGRVEEFRSWARATHPAELEYLVPGGRLDPSGDRPARHRVLLVEWRKAAGLPGIE